MRPHRALTGLLLVATLTAANAFVSDAQISPDAIAQAVPSTVLLVTVLRDRQGGYTCSGSFVTSFGLILTASHCVRAVEDDERLGIKKGQLLDPEGLVYIGVNLPNRIKPVPALQAQLVVDDPVLDVALLKPVALLGRDKPVAVPADYHAPVLKIADSDTLRIGDPVAVLGFPGIGGDSITVTQGHVTGFTADNANNKTWLKHDASTGHGASGGPIINARGEQIAVTSSGVGEEHSPEVSYRSALTNRIPAAWARYFQGGTAAGPTAPPPSPPAPPGPTAPPRPPGPQAPPPAPGPPPAPQPSPTPQPVPQPPASAGSVLRGRIVDGASGAGIPNAIVVILRPGVSPQSAQRSDVVANAQTDAGGAFQTSPAVRKGAVYPVVIGARGYFFITGTIEIPTTASDVIVVNRPFELQRE